MICFGEELVEDEGDREGGGLLLDVGGIMSPRASGGTPLVQL